MSKVFHERIVASVIDEAAVPAGMGVNIPDIRQIVHIGVPRTLKRCYQEMGSAGRDVKPVCAFHKLHASLICIYENSHFTKIYS